LRNVQALRELLGPETPLMVDANQGWELEEAMQMASALAGFGLHWLEEPLRADRPWSEWRQLARQTIIPLAAGENAMGGEAFDAAIASGALRVLQPDLAKWGGISGCWPVIGRALQAGLRYCPHFLGGGVGLLASAHVLAAAGGDGMLEIDANPNPLRSALTPQLASPAQGTCHLGETPGIGSTPDLQELANIAARGA
jgi:D-galactarolactone cycloisomerase